MILLAAEVFSTGLFGVSSKHCIEIWRIIYCVLM